MKVRMSFHIVADAFDVEVLRKRLHQAIDEEIELNFLVQKDADNV